MIYCQPVKPRSFTRKRVCILFTGGAESTALCEHALQEDVIFDLVHMIHNNRSSAEMINGDKIAMYYEKVVYNIQVIADLFDERYVRHYRDNMIWLGMAIAKIPRGLYDEVWFGTHKGEIETAPTLFDMWDNAMSLGGEDTIIRTPLSALTKEEQYSIIPDEIKKLVVQCEYLTLKDGKPVKCNDCGKCREWQKLVKDA